MGLDPIGIMGFVNKILRLKRNGHWTILWSKGQVSTPNLSKTMKKRNGMASQSHECLAQVVVRAFVNSLGRALKKTLA